MKKIAFVLIFFCLHFYVTQVAAKTVVIVNANTTFSPNTVTANVGDTIDFQLESPHNVLEVSKSNWDLNAATPLTGGITLPFGGGKVILAKAGTIYYVCITHAAFGMKGTITVVDPNNPTPSNLGGIIVNGDSMKFTPATVNARVGDTINFQLPADINAVEVSKSVWANGGSTSNGGFITPNGGGKVILSQADTLYYVSEKYSGFGQKGVINVRARGDFYVARLSGVQEEFPVLSMASAEVIARLDGDTLYISGSFKNLSGDYTNSHFHRGYAGITGGVQIGFTPVIDSTKRSGTWNQKFVVTEAQKTMIKNREFYANVHSTPYPGGEIRGQLVPESDAYYQVNMVGSEQVPPLMTTAHGSLFAELTGSTLVVTGSAKEISSGYTASHFHIGFPGQSGGVQIAFKPTITDTAGKTSVTYLAADNTFTLTPNQLALLKAGQLYANVHSTTFPAGEFRGQLTPLATAKFRVHYSGAYEPTPVTSQASGGLILNLVDSTLTVSGSFAGLESNMNTAAAGGAHLHKGMAGQNGGIQLAMNTVINADNRGGVFLPESNTFKLSATNLDDLFARRLYANVHSLNYAGGEIRGQVVPESQYVMFGFFNGMQENKPVLTTGKGDIVIEVNGNKVTVSGSADRLLGKVNPAIGSHLHFGAVGQNGGIRIPLTYTHPTADSMSVIWPASANSYTVSAGFLDTLRRRQVYANVHTFTAPGGEVRAQLNHEATAYFQSIMSGSSEPAAINTTAVGGIMGELSGKNLTVSGSFSKLTGQFNPAIAGGAHIHGGLPGTNGGIKYNLTTTLSADSLSGTWLPATNVFALSDGAIDSLRKRMLYSNVHTTKYAGGELRGNFHNLANAIFTANLSPLNELVVNGSGNGVVKAELLDTKLTVTGSFAGLTGDFNRAIAGGAHLHSGVNGVNGGIIIPLSTVTNADNKGGQFLADSNTITVTSDQILLLGTGSVYANVHSTTAPGGEIRGQLYGEINNFPGVVTITSPALGDTVKVDTKGQDSVITFSWSKVTDPDGHPVVYKIQSALLPDFSIILSTGFVGTNNLFAIPSKTLDSTLAAFGVPAGGSITLPFRVLSSDGSLNTLGVPAFITFQRVITTAVIDEFVKSYSMMVYPVPATQTAMIEINAKNSGSMEMRVIDLSGRVEHARHLNLLSGINRVTLDVSNYPTGVHFIQMFQHGKNVAYFKLQKQ
ncbi:MAG: CHRD domain-containing protein [Saprospiraceae bacterium]